MRQPIRHVAKDGTVTFRVRYRLHGDTSTTFRGPEMEAHAEAVEFSRMIHALGPERAVEWLRGKDTERATAVSPTLDEWASEYIDALTKAGPGTKHGYRQSWALTFGAQLGHLRLNQLTRKDIAAAVNELVYRGGRKGTGYSDKSMANHFGLLRAMLDMAVADKHLVENPTRTIELPERTGHQALEMYLFGLDEYDALLDVMHEHYRPLVETLAGTGIRYGEAEALLVSDVNLRAMTLRVSKAAKWDTSKSQRIIGPTKTKNGNRTVTLPRETAEALRPIVEGRPRNARLFLAPKGGPLRHKAFWEYAWVPACEAIGLGEDPRPRIHDLRHSHASWLIAQNVPLPVIQKRLGHHSITVTVDIYGHLSPDIQRAAADAASMFFSQRREIEGAVHEPGEVAIFRV